MFQDAEMPLRTARSPGTLAELSKTVGTVTDPRGQRKTPLSVGRLLAQPRTLSDGRPPLPIDA